MEQTKCLKCGGAMIEGQIKFEQGNYSSQSMNPLFARTNPAPLPGIYESQVATPQWVEKTGEKTGFIFKSDETRTLQLAGRRCSLCGFVELYVDAGKGPA